MVLSRSGEGAGDANFLLKCLAVHPICLKTFVVLKVCSSIYRLYPLWGKPSSSRNRAGNRVARLSNEKSMPCLKITILWSLGNPLPNPIHRINSNVQICLKIPPLESSWNLRVGCKNLVMHISEIFSFILGELLASCLFSSVMNLQFIKFIGDTFPHLSACLQ